MYHDSYLQSCYLIISSVFDAKAVKNIFLTHVIEFMEVKLNFQNKNKLINYSLASFNW